jgi:ketol-acid reductoisomerase
MVQGFNHNILYKGVVFHVQTEDSGLKNPHITTLLYRHGTIIASKKTDYSDIITVEMLEKVVEDLMKEQHKEMLRRLKSGEFDSRAFAEGEQPDQRENVSSQASPEHQHADGASSPDKPPKQEQTLDEMILEYLASVKD